MTAVTPSHRGPAVVVVTKESEGSAVAHHAVRVAAEQERPALLLVPMRRPAFTTDPLIAARVHRRALREAEALADRVRPVLDAAGLSVSVQVAWHGTFSLRRSRPPRAAALARASRRAGAAVIVTPVDLPAALTRGVRTLRVTDDEALHADLAH